MLLTHTKAVKNAKKKSLYSKFERVTYLTYTSTHCSDKAIKNK